MATKPIDKLLDSVEWEAVNHVPPPTHKLPYATHFGILTIGDLVLKCYQLSNGQRVFDADDIEKFFKE